MGASGLIISALDLSRLVWHAGAREAALPTPAIAPGSHAVTGSAVVITPGVPQGSNAESWTDCTPIGTSFALRRSVRPPTVAAFSEPCWLHLSI